MKYRFKKYLRAAAIAAALGVFTVLTAVMLCLCAGAEVPLYCDECGSTSIGINGGEFAENCNDPCYDFYSCITCGYDGIYYTGSYLDHEWGEYSYTVVDGCTTAYSRQCLRCGDIADGSYSEHRFDGNMICRCGNVIFDENFCNITYGDHSYSPVFESSSTCISQGYVEYSCSHCFGVKKELVPLASHVYGEWITVGWGNCLATQQRTCLICSDVEVIDDVVLHDFTKGGNTCSCGAVTKEENESGHTHKISQYTGMCEYCGQPCEHQWLTDGSHKCSICSYKHTINDLDADDMCDTCGYTYVIVSSCTHKDAVYSYSYVSEDLHDAYCSVCGLLKATEEHEESKNYYYKYIDETLVKFYECKCGDLVKCQEILLEDFVVLKRDKFYTISLEKFKTLKYIVVCCDGKNNIANMSMGFYVQEKKSFQTVETKLKLVVDHIPGTFYVFDLANKLVYKPQPTSFSAKITLTGEELWHHSSSGNYFYTNASKAFTNYYVNSFPEGASFTISDNQFPLYYSYSTSHSQSAFNLDGSSQRIKFRFGDLSGIYAGAPIQDLDTFLAYLKDNPVTIFCNREENVMRSESILNSSFYSEYSKLINGTSQKPGMNPELDDNSFYLKGYNDALATIINDNPIQGFFQGLWTGFILFISILGTGISIGGISLQSVITTVTVVLVAVFAVKVIRKS